MPFAATSTSGWARWRRHLSANERTTATPPTNARWRGTGPPASSVSVGPVLLVTQRVDRVLPGGLERRPHPEDQPDRRRDPEPQPHRPHRRGGLELEGGPHEKGRAEAESDPERA